MRYITKSEILTEYDMFHDLTDVFIIPIILVIGLLIHGFATSKPLPPVDDHQLKNPPPF